MGRPAKRPHRAMYRHFNVNERPLCEPLGEFKSVNITLTGYLGDVDCSKCLKKIKSGRFNLGLPKVLREVSEL